MGGASITCRAAAGLDMTLAIPETSTHLPDIDIRELVLELLKLVVPL